MHCRSVEWAEHAGSGRRSSGGHAGGGGRASCGPPALSRRSSEDAARLARSGASAEAPGARRARALTARGAPGSVRPPWCLICAYKRCRVTVLAVRLPALVDGPMRRAERQRGGRLADSKLAVPVPRSPSRPVHSHWQALLHSSAVRPSLEPSAAETWRPLCAGAAARPHGAALAAKHVLWGPPQT